MDEITIEGKRYISSKRAAEVTGYTKDYVGQLARSNKILATRVGRAWYVGEEAIKQHAGLLIEEDGTVDDPVVLDENLAPITSKKRSAEPEAVVSKQDEQSLNELAIRPSNATEKRLSLNAMRFQSFQTEPKKPLLNTWSNIRYLPDDSHVFPVVAKRSPKAAVTVATDGTASVPISRGTSVIHHVVASEPQKPKTEKKPAVDTTGVVRSIDGITKKQKPDSISRYIEMNMKRQKKRQSQHTPILTYAGAIAIALVAIGAAASMSFPSEWAFSQKSFLTANSGDIGESYSLILEYFMNIITDGLELIALFLGTFLASLGDLFDIGLEFINNLLNLG